MTVILVDTADKNHDLQLSNRAWDCLVTNLSREKIFDAHKMEMLEIPTVGSLNNTDSNIFAKAIVEKLIARLSDDHVLFHDGTIGKRSKPKLDGNENPNFQEALSLNTPYQLSSSLSKETLEKVVAFSNACAGFKVY